MVRLENEIESATTDKTISISGILEKTSSDERVTIPAGLHIVLMKSRMQQLLGLKHRL